MEVTTGTYASCFLRVCLDSFRCLFTASARLDAAAGRAPATPEGMRNQCADRGAFQARPPRNMSDPWARSEGVLRVTDNGDLALHVAVLHTNWKKYHAFVGGPRCRQRRMSEVTLLVWCPPAHSTAMKLRLDGRRALLPSSRAWCRHGTCWISLQQLLLLPDELNAWGSSDQMQLGSN